MTHLVVVADWLRIKGRKCELANLSHLGLSNDIIVSIRKWGLTLLVAYISSLQFLRLSGDFSHKNMLKGTLKFKFRYNTEKINTKFHISYQS